jgi:hypothetical protein
VDGTGLEPCPVAGFGISGVELLSSVTIALVTTFYRIIIWIRDSSVV